MASNCIDQVWQAHEPELRAWLRSRLRHEQEAEDLLQDVFLRALRQGARFCELAQPRAWLFAVARNAVIDRARLNKDWVELPEDLAAEAVETDGVASLVECLPTALARLSPPDRAAIQACDLEGLGQQEFAVRQQLSLAAAKSRLQRARRRLKLALRQSCGVRFDEQGKVCCHRAPDAAFTDTL